MNILGPVRRMPVVEGIATKFLAYNCGTTAANLRVCLFVNPQSIVRRINAIKFYVLCYIQLYTHVPMRDPNYSKVI
jgi:hypothetical protein